MPYYVAAWQIVLTEYGCEVADAEIYRREGESKAKSAIELLGGLTNVEADPRVLAKVIRAVEQAYEEIFEFRLFPEALETVRGLKEKNVLCGLVTGSSRTTLEFLRRQNAELFDLFDCVITGDDVPTGKPAPDPYLAGVAGLGVSADTCVAIENAPLGIMSARAAQLTCLAVRGSSPVPERLLFDAGANVLAKDMRELRKYLVWADSNVPLKKLLGWVKPNRLGA